MVKKIVNPNIIRITNSENWKSKYFEKKASDLPTYSIRDAKIRDFIRNFFKNHKITINSCELYHKNKSIDIVLSYWQNPESIYMIRKIRKTRKIVLKKTVGENSYLEIFPGFVKKKSREKNIKKPEDKDLIKKKKAFFKLNPKLVLNSIVKTLFLKSNKLNSKYFIMDKLTGLKKTSQQILTDKIRQAKTKKLRRIILNRKSLKQIISNSKSLKTIQKSKKNLRKDLSLKVKKKQNSSKFQFKEITNHFSDNGKTDIFLKNLLQTFWINAIIKTLKKVKVCIKTFNSSKNITNKISSIVKKNRGSVQKKMKTFTRSKGEVQSDIKKIWLKKKFKQLNVLLKKNIYLKKKFKQLNVLLKKKMTALQANVNLAGVYKKVYKYILKLKEISSEILRFLSYFARDSYVEKVKVYNFFIDLQKLTKIFSFNKINLNFVNCLESLQKNAFSTILLTNTSFVTLNFKYTYINYFICTFIKKNNNYLKQISKHFFKYKKNNPLKRFYNKFFNALQLRLRKQISKYIKKIWNKHLKNRKKCNFKTFYGIKLNKNGKRVQIKRNKLGNTEILSIKYYYLDLFFKKTKLNSKMRIDHVKFLPKYFALWLKYCEQKIINNSEENFIQRRFNLFLKQILLRGRGKRLRDPYHKGYRRMAKVSRLRFPKKRRKKNKKKNNSFKKKLPNKILKKMKLKKIFFKFLLKKFEIKKKVFENMFLDKKQIESFLIKKGYLKEFTKSRWELKNIYRNLMKHVYNNFLLQKKAIKNYKLRFAYLSVMLKKPKPRRYKRGRWTNYKIQKKIQKANFPESIKSHISEYLRLFKQHLNLKESLKFFKYLLKKSVGKHASKNKIYKIISEYQKEIAENKILILNHHIKYKTLYKRVGKLGVKLHKFKRFQPFNRTYNKLKFKNLKKKKKYRKFISFLNKNLNFFFFIKRKNKIKKLKKLIRQTDEKKIFGILKKEKHKLKYNRIKNLSSYKKILSMRGGKNFNDFNSNSFFERFFESLSKYLKYRENITLILQPLNKESIKFFKNSSSLKGGVFRLRRFSRRDYFQEGLNIILFCMTHENSTNLLAEFLSTQLKKLKKFVNYFLKFVKNALVQFSNPKYSSVVRGVKIQIKGRLSRAPRAKKKTIKVGKFLPILTLKSKVGYSETTSYAANGTFSVKVWMVYE